MKPGLYKRDLPDGFNGSVVCKNNAFLKLTKNEIGFKGLFREQRGVDAENPVNIL
ncbi:hypothetical protein M731_10450 [Neisseria gonorrhoeae ATL_2011_01-25]|uniref:Uncharacterized protein n=1 Tax=Neisseria gonorrhoeae 3502 TaxID=1193404 RepID=A0AA44UAH8_NEIGO|nr:hypothetical protein T556_00870 [Neisseria gonorrhoeae NG-k51.05]KLS13134.1 hypothetical protein M716_05700 [Neisseria gonorrhoeae SK32402]KLS22689.1 hypothetical protein M731_10450 [Neisseria gonorrhoeae ATL_2011_01-25]KLS24511.1 hypothetical protein M737_08620 [Neisseria gonorrhoeae MIA_2011_05-10]KLS30225.1 hypothetical protein M722_11330 [Neisseria gonorrhoeae ALB_2011_04_03]KLS41247.1 hypothetical protein M689_08775 [Neisseria gonorrhoeae SK23020]KLS47060.1 hypothetical protein M797_1